MTENFPDLFPALPELILLGTAILLLMIGVLRPSDDDGPATTFALVGMVLALVVVAFVPSETGTTFEGLFVSDTFTRFMKGLVLVGAVLTLVMARGFRQREKMNQFEYPVLLTFATLGMLMMVSANDLMSLYVGIELHSLPLYVIAAFRRDNRRSTEAGLKYFILGALSSGMLLYGCSLVYGFAGSTNFDGLAAVLGGQETHVGVLIGLVFVTAGLAFKISAVPFHMWTPDVYEGAPTAITAFFAAAPKVAAMALFLRVLIDPFGGLIEEWRQIVVFIAVASMLLGAFAAIYQTNIKRLMAYSSIGNIGYALVGLATGSEAGVQAVIVYMAIYLIMTIGAFGCIMAMRVNGQMVEGISDLAGLGKSRPMIAAALAVLMFSMAGIPPLAGFFGKLYVFLAAVEAELYGLAVIGVLTSVVGAFYYLRIVKLMYFDEERESFDRPLDSEVSLVIAGTSLLILVFFAYPTPLLAGAASAASALFP
jgi:NADH-quinone oxidoreductase subunit N